MYKINIKQLDGTHLFGTLLEICQNIITSFSKEWGPWAKGIGASYHQKLLEKLYVKRSAYSFNQIKEERGIHH